MDDPGVYDPSVRPPEYGTNVAEGLKTYEDPNAPFRMANIGGPQYEQFHQWGPTGPISGGDAPNPVQYGMNAINQDKMPQLQIPKGMPDPGLGGGANAWGYVPSPGPGKGAPGQLHNDSLQFYDPNYGWMTPSNNFANLAPTGIKKYLSMGANAMPYVALGAATMGAGALAGPALAPFVSAGVGAANGVMNGGSAGSILAGAAGGLIGGYTGIPGGATIGKQAANYLVPNTNVAENPYAHISQGPNTMATPTYPNGGETNVGEIVPPLEVTATRPPEEQDPWGFQGEVFPQDGSWPPGTGPSQGGGSGGFNPLSFVGGAINGITGNSGNPFGIGSAAGSAALNYMNQRDYQNVLDKYVPQMDPFGSQRAGYQGMLKKAWDDPTSVLNDPAHKAIQERQMAALGAKLGASGYMGSGLEKMNLADYLATSDNQFLGQEKDRLALLGGANIGPAAAAGLIGTATKGIMDSRSNMYADATRAINPNGGSAPGTPRGTGTSPVGAAGDAAVGQLVNQGGGYLKTAVNGIPAGSFVTSGGTILAANGQQIGTYINGQVQKGFATDNPNTLPESGYPDPGRQVFPDYTQQNLPDPSDVLGSQDWYTQSTGFLFND